MSAMTQPSAEVTPGKRGTSARASPTSRISAPGMQRAAAAERHQRELASDRARARSRRAAARRPCAHWRRAGSPPRPPRRRGRAGAPTLRLDRARRRIGVEPRELAADRPLGVDAAEHDIGVRHRRPRRRPRRSRPAPATEPALSGPTCSSPAASTRAIEPPPAPIVVISIIGVRTTSAEIERALRRQRRLAAGDQRDVERGAADIAGDDVGKSRLGRRYAPRRSRPPPGRTARCARAGAAPSRRSSRRRWTARSGTRRRTRRARSRASSAREIGADDRLQHRVQRGRAGALELADLRAGSRWRSRYARSARRSRAASSAARSFAGLA